MCGVFAYSGNQQDAVSKALAGLKRLEYRGYDSWGVAAVDSDAAANSIWVHKQVGKISGAALTSDDAPNSVVALAHTRWATHGGITQENAHPHQATDGSFVVVQNGIVQNFAELKAELKQQGYRFVSETDTEVIVRLIEAELKLLLSKKTAKPTLEQYRQAVRAAFLRLEGRNTIVLLTAAGELVAARQGSPLVVGKGQHTNEWWLSSDTLSFADQVKQIVVIDNGQLLTLDRAGSLGVWSIRHNKQLPYRLEKLNLERQTIDKEGFPHFMLKEIHESPVVVEQVARQPKAPLQKLAKAIKKAAHVYTIGSGTAGIAAAQMAYFLRHHGHIVATSLVGADAVEYMALMQAGDVLIAPSQSGETADVLEILEQAKAKGVLIATYVNMQGSSMSRLADFPFMAQAGPEVCVMSTKVYVSQLAWAYLLAQTVAGNYDSAAVELQALSQEMARYLKSAALTKQLRHVTEVLLPAANIFLLGKAQQLQTIREGMVKLIEGSYKHAHALPAGDLKHYAITLMEKGVPVIVVCAQDEVVSDVMNAAHEVKARGATIIGIGPDSYAKEFDHYLAVPDTGETMSLISVIPLQLLAYHLTVALGNDVDHPRNIAKSVTVK